MASPVTLGIVGVLAAALGVLLVRWVRWYLHFRKLELAMPGPPSLPVLGNMLDWVGVSDKDQFARIQKQMEGRRSFLRITLLGNMLVVVNNAEEIDEVMRRKDLSDKSHWFYDLLHVVAKNGLIQMNGPLWREHRKALQPAFTLNILEQFVDYFAEEAEGFVRRCDDTRPDENLLENLRRVTSGAFMKTTLSEEVGPEFEEEIMGFLRFLEMFLRSVNERSFQPLLWPNFIFGLTGPGRLIIKTKSKIDHYAHLVLNKRREELRKMGELDSTDDFVKRPMTLVDTLLQSGKLSDGDIVDEFKTFFAAGVDTTAATIIWLLKALSLHPDIQDRVYSEIQTVFEGSDRRATPNDLTRLEYTDRFIKETMRLFPTVPFVARQVKEETQLCGYTIPANTTIAINILSAHRDPVHWPDPLRFDPDRFLPENCEGRHPCAYMPFSSGYRNCIGGKYALMNMTTFLATVLRTYRIDPVNDGYKNLLDIPVFFDIALRAVGGMTVKFTPRKRLEANAA